MVALGLDGFGAPARKHKWCKHCTRALTRRLGTRSLATGTKSVISTDNAHVPAFDAKDFMNQITHFSCAPLFLRRNGESGTQVSLSVQGRLHGYS